MSPTGVYVRVPLTPEQLQTIGEAWDVLRDIVQTAGRAEKVLAKARRRS